LAPVCRTLGALISANISADWAAFAEAGITNNSNIIVSSLWCIALAAATMACKPLNQSASKTASLDNIAAGPFTLNTCGDPAIAFDFDQLRAAIQAPDSLINDVRAAIGAVPDVLRKSFFYDLGGHLVVDSAAAEQHCRQYLNSRTPTGPVAFKNDGANFLACPAPNGNRFDLYVTADKAAIRHSMVRLFSYVYSTLIVQGMAGSNNPDLTDEASAQLNKMTVLSTNFLGEAPGADSGMSSQAFARVVFAEALDSYYCSKTTNATFSTRFPRTFAVFTQYQMAPDDLSYTEIFGKTWF
jgi:hypothetical protein